VNAGRALGVAVTASVVALGAALPAAANPSPSITTRRIVRSPIAMQVSWTGNGAPTITDPFSSSVSTRGCAEFRLVGRWHLVASDGSARSYPAVEAVVMASPNRRSTITWKDRGSGLGDAVGAPDVGTVVRVRSPWFRRVARDRVAVTVSVTPAMARALDPVADQWSIDRLDLACRPAARST
jgi:hypothetical protein